MIDVLWNIISCVGLILLTLAIIGTNILLMCSIICIVKQTNEEFGND